MISYERESTNLPKFWLEKEDKRLKLAEFSILIFSEIKFANEKFHWFKTFYNHFCFWELRIWKIYLFTVNGILENSSISNSNDPISQDSTRMSFEMWIFLEKFPFLGEKLHSKVHAERLSVFFENKFLRKEFWIPVKYLYKFTLWILALFD